MTLPASASADVSTRISRLSTRSVVVAYVSMTCTPFRSSIGATREGHRHSPRYSFRECRITALPFSSLRLRSISHPLYAWGSYGPLAYPRAVGHGPVGGPRQGGSGCGKGP